MPYIGFYFPKDNRAKTLFSKVTTYSKALGISRNLILYKMLWESRRKINKIVRTIQKGVKDERSRKIYIQTPRRNKIKATAKLK